ncbi:MAG TPA: hypothetical protein VFE65_37490 [Pseudonocardia sp.]|jgi:hypothetical protein|nr:hypothetical protein [Pseudonocardia sp.]
MNRHARVLRAIRQVIEANTNNSANSREVAAYMGTGDALDIAQAMRDLEREGCVLLLAGTFASDNVTVERITRHGLLESDNPL